MSEPETSEEYIAQVARQAEAQENEEVPSLAELVKAQQEQNAQWIREQRFFILLLVLVASGYLALRLISSEQL